MEEKGNSKKIIFIIVAVFVLFFGFVAWWLITGKPSTPAQEVSNTRNLEQMETPSPQTTSQPTTPAWKKYTNQYFSINYPADYTLSDGVFAGNGTLTTFAKGDLKVMAQTTADPKMQTKEIIDRYTTAGYKLTTTKIGDIQAAVVEGSLGGSVLEKGYVFDFNGRTYRIIIMYKLGQIGSEGQILDQMVNTFSPAP